MTVSTAAATAPGAHEAHEHTHYTTTGLDNRKVAIWAFIGSECMLFASLISTYLIYKGRSVVGPFPHEAWTSPSGQKFGAILNIPVTSASTFVLLMSSLAMVLALAAVENKGKPGYEGLLGSTSFVHEGLTIKTNLFGSSFFTLTGFHGTHVAVGVLWLMSLLFIDIRRGLGPKDTLIVDICALYWHFVDVVWIVIFTLVYLIK